MRTDVLIAQTVALVLFVGTAACTAKPGSSPRATLVAYLDASFAGDAEHAYAWLSQSDQRARPLAEFKEAVGGLAGSLGELLKRQSSYKVLTVSEDGDKATIEVETKVPDVASVLGDLLVGAMAAAFAGGEEQAKKEVEDKVKARLVKGDLPTKTEVVTFHLRREGQWRVFMDYETDAKVRAAMAEVEQLRKAKKLEAVVSKLDEVLRLRPDQEEAKQEKVKAEREWAAYKEKRDYIRNVQLYDFRAQKFRSYLDERVPGVEFKLKNLGDRTLNEVEVTVYFKDAEGNVIHEHAYNPVLVSKYAFGRENQPLKPKYVWQMEHGHFYKATSVPSEWKEGAATATVTNIEFEDAEGGAQ